MRKVPQGILLIFLAPVAGQRGDQLIISQADWEQDGSEVYSPNLSLPELRLGMNTK